MALILTAAAFVALVFLIGYQLRWLLAIGLVIVLAQYVWYDMKLTGKGVVNSVSTNEVYQLPKKKHELDAVMTSDKFTFDIAGIKTTTGRIGSWEVSPSIVIHNTTDRVLKRARIECRYQTIDTDPQSKIQNDLHFVVLDLPPGETKTVTYTFKERIPDYTGRGLRAIRCYTSNFEEVDQWDKPV